MATAATVAASAPSATAATAAAAAHLLAAAASAPAIQPLHKLVAPPPAAAKAATDLDWITVGISGIFFFSIFS